MIAEEQFHKAKRLFPPKKSNSRHFKGLTVSEGGCFSTVFSPASDPERCLNIMTNS